MKVMLDTNTCIAVMRGNPKAIARMEVLPPGDCAVSVVTVYELFTGVAKCQEPVRERAKVMNLLSRMHLLSFTGAAARQAATVRADLEKPAKSSVLTICCWQAMRSL